MADAPDVVHHWRLTGQPDGGYPHYDFTWSSADSRWAGPAAEACARGFLQRVTSAWTDVTFTHRTVTISPWEDASPEGDTDMPAAARPRADADATQIRAGLERLRTSLAIIRGEEGMSVAVGHLMLSVRLYEERLTELEGTGA